MRLTQTSSRAPDIVHAVFIQCFCVQDGSLCCCTQPFFIAQANFALHVKIAALPSGCHCSQCRLLAVTCYCMALVCLAVCFEASSFQ